MTHHLCVIFSRGAIKITRPVGWTKVWLTRLVSRSMVSHVSVGDGDRVLETSFDGCRLINFDAYMLHYPAIAGYVLVPSTEAPDLARYDGSPPPSSWRTALSWLTLGLVNDPANCVSVVAENLRRAGVHIPPRTHTPVKLLEALVAAGHEYREMG